MKLEEIFDNWNTDSVIDKTNLGDESISIPKLHNKYYKIYTSEKLLLRKLESEMKALKLDKYEFYTQGPSKESQEKGWKLPPKGVVIKQEVQMYLDADREIIELSLRIGYQQEKIDLLDSILKTLIPRGWQIKNAIDFYKFTMGG